ncbi:uL15 family ribosomal protein [Candidatus Giovannonibacteria bacterium]|nr:uL15 family ribosomal protein [Candidatus Giovannonibacteria bacterium]
MQVHDLPKSIGRTKRRVGRGGKRGSYSGHGIKGQKARSGHRIRPQIRDIIKKIHKRRGHGRNVSASSAAYRVKPLVVNLADIEKKFNAGEKVTPESLGRAGLIVVPKGKNIKVKILGGGELTKKLSFDKDFLVSQTAKSKIEKTK